MAERAADHRWARFLSPALLMVAESLRSRGDTVVWDSSAKIMLRTALAIAHLIVGGGIVAHIMEAGSLAAAAVPVGLLLLFAAVSLLATISAVGRPLSVRVGNLFITIAALVPYLIFGGTLGWQVLTVLAFAGGILLPRGYLVASFGVVIVGLFIILAAKNGLILAVTGAIILATAVLLGFVIAWAVETGSVLRETQTQLLPSAVAAERMRIIRELQSALGPSVDAALARADAAESALAESPERAVDEITALHAQIRQALQQMRAVVVDYRQPDLAEQIGAAQALLSSAGIRVDIEGSPLNVPAEARIAAAYVIREAASNIVRHTRARRCTIRLTDCVVSVIDDGIAIDDGSLAGNGLLGVTERVRHSGGTLEYGPLQPAGFTVTGIWEGRG